MNEVEHCPTCGQSVNERQITLFSGMVDALITVFRWCETRQQYEFTRKEIKHLFKNENQIARFGDWVLFGGLVYRPDHRKGHYGINRERVVKFISSDLEIPSVIWKNPLTKELKMEKYVTINEIPNLLEFLDENLEYIAKYREPGQIALL